jgi:hypothetical protein
MFAGVGLVTVVPGVCEEVPDREGSGDFRMLAADARRQYDADLPEEVNLG